VSNCGQDEVFGCSTPPTSLRSTEAHSSGKTTSASTYYNVVAVGQTNGVVKRSACQSGSSAASPPREIRCTNTLRLVGEKNRNLRRNSYAEMSNLSVPKARYERLTRSCPCLVTADGNNTTEAHYINMDDMLPDKDAKSSRNVHSVKRRSSDMLENTATKSMSPSRKYHTSSSSSQTSCGPPLLKTMPKKPVSGVNATQPLPYYDLGPFDGDICDDGYLYFGSDDCVAPRASASGVSRPAVKERALPCVNRLCNAGETDGVRRSVVTTSDLLNCVPPAPPSTDRGTSSTQSPRSGLPPHSRPVNLSEHISQYDGPVLCAVDFQAALARGTRSGYRVGSAFSGDRRQKLTVDEPDYLDMSRERLLDLQRQGTYGSASQTSNTDYLPMDSVSRSIDATKYSYSVQSPSVNKSCRLVKSQSADGLIDQMDSESGSDTAQKTGKTPHLIARMLGSRNRSSAGPKSDFADDETQQSLLCSSATSIATDTMPESFQTSRTFFACQHLQNAESRTATLNNCEQEVGGVETSDEGKVELPCSCIENDEPPPLPEKLRTGNGLNSPLSLVPPVPPRVGIDNVRPASAASVRPRSSRKPDLTVDIPKTTSDHGKYTVCCQCL
jgi:hypothetical protein